MVYRWLNGVMIVLLGVGGTQRALAQSYPDCPPPASGEYLLLVQGEDEADRDRTISVLPADQPTLVCSYLDDTVVRAGGFTSLEVANSWALYLNDIEQLNTVVVEAEDVAAAPAPQPEATAFPAEETASPVEETAAPAQESPAPATSVAAISGHSTKYQPTLLGEGVAVLVDYQQNPEIGRELAQQGPVGLAVYLQQPYLLVLHTTDRSMAATKLQQLVDRGLTSFLVDGEQVIRLTQTVQ